MKTLKITAVVYLIGIAYLLTSCDKLKKMENKEDFSWSASVTSAVNYPIEVHVGYLATREKFITGFQNNGIQKSGWATNGSEGGSGGKSIPTLVSLTWVSYAEKKFWKLDEAVLPKEKMLSLFRKGFENYDRVSNSLTHQTYDHIVVAVAPGGVVAVFLTGDHHRTEIARFQAKATHVDVNEFYDNPDNDTQQQFYDWWFNNSVPIEIREKIAKKGIPYGLWDTYGEKYNWKFTPEFYKKDIFKYAHTTFFNGEEENIYEEELNKKLFYKNALPSRASISFGKYWYRAEFDWDEVHGAFLELTKENRDAEIEIIAKVGFEYNDVEFIAKSNGRSIPLTKTKGNMWSNL